MSLAEALRAHRRGQSDADGEAAHDDDDGGGGGQEAGDGDDDDGVVAAAHAAELRRAEGAALADARAKARAAKARAAGAQAGALASDGKRARTLDGRGDAPRGRCNTRNGFF
jgi:hypothetical protein